MRYSVKSGKPEKQKSDCAIVAWFDKGKLPAEFKALDAASGDIISSAARRGDLRSDPGYTAMLQAPRSAPCKRILVIGCGKKPEFSRKAYRKVVEAAGRVIAETGAKTAVSFLPEPADHRSGATLATDVVAGIESASYRFDKMKSKSNRKPTPPLSRFTIVTGDRKTLNEVREGLRVAQAIASGVGLARDLGNLPANVCTPRYLAGVARRIAGRSKKASARILGPAEIKRLGMGAFMSVAAGASEPARLIVLRYRGAAPDKKPTVLVGKGITFDTGGISLKPGRAMDEMKFDMCGAAGVLGAMRAIVDLGVDSNVIAVVPACVNMPDGRATNPGDVIKTMSGKTVEILNTDAEGRLILCDALTYARRFKPRLVIDVATLTGACVIALGPHLTGLMSKDEALASGLLEAGEEAGDPAWRLPLSDEYGEGLASNFADFANVGGREGGASIAASYLSRFTDGLRWAHLDIAGTAWTSGKAKGATGRPVGLLVHFILGQS